MDQLAAIEMGERRSGLCATVMGDKVYLAGGHSGETPLKLFEVFEPGPEIDSRGSWKRLPPMLARRVYCTGDAVGSLVYIMGGSADGRTLNTVEVFDTERCEWAHWFTRPPMQVKRTLHASVMCQGRLFVVGGFDGMRDLALVEEYDVQHNTWVWKTSLDTGRSYLAIAACDGQLYAIGGQDRNPARAPDAERAHRSVERFDLYSERWYEAAPLLVGRVGAAAATLACEDGAEYVFTCGGSDGEGALASMERYDPRADKWTEAPPMGAKRLGHCTVVVNNRLYVIGGFDGKEPLGTFECFDPVLNKWGPLLQMGDLSQGAQDEE